MTEAHRLAAEHEEKGYAEALASARALGMRPLEALCHLGLGSSSLARRGGMASRPRIG